MTLSTWPLDILSLVLSLLAINGDPTQEHGDKCLMRLLTQPILKSTTIDSPNSNPSKTSLGSISMMCS
jgi:hypothetical protein